MEYRSGMQSEYAPVEFTVSGILYDRDEYTIEASYVVFGSQDFIMSVLRRVTGNIISILP